jgi:hypothetical protein
MFNAPAKVNKERTRWRLKTDTEITQCPCCGQDVIPTELIVYFKKPHNITIYESDVLYNTYIEQKNEAMAYYAQCDAGKEFRKNIERVVFA